MECVGAMCEGEWNNVSSSEEADFMAQLLGGNCWFPPNEVQIMGADLSSSFPMGGQNHVGYYYHPNFIMDDDGKNNGFRVANDAVVEAQEEDMIGINIVEESDDLQLGLIEKTKKRRVRLPLDVPIRNGKLNKSCVKIRVCSEEDDSNGAMSWSSSSKGSGALKTRANRGSATDPQSLYARKRRERINERLRILQNLVPNGTKVDLTTMLEEAVQYVKFLQLQIKLLSSDELWMYAPIAYNGMDIGLDHINIPTPKSQSS